jgi:hypothetical protein
LLTPLIEKRWNGNFANFPLPELLRDQRKMADA